MSEPLPIQIAADLREVEWEIPQSPAGRVEVSGWRVGGQIPARGGSAIVLPLLTTRVTWPGVHAVLDVGAYALAPAGARLHGGAGLIIYTPAYAGLPQCGGPIEATGRLRYIDGCSDSLIVCPPLKGEPCLNFLHLPEMINQTEHVHPSDRIGIIVRGSGVCSTAAGDQKLTAGSCWWIPTGARHSFHTLHDSLDVFAWHPDSDFGPSHDDHPMVSRTIVDGAAANDARHAAIRTTEIRA